MTALELRTELHKAIDSIPENVLPEILDYIQAVQKSDFSKVQLDMFIDKVFKEDDNLLKRLAE